MDRTLVLNATANLQQQSLIFPAIDRTSEYLNNALNNDFEIACTIQISAQQARAQYSPFQPLIINSTSARITWSPDYPSCEVEESVHVR
jgi:hypothetical protein